MSARGPHESGGNGDARLLRRTRLRLVAWSGSITLVVLVVLGMAVYGTVAWSLASSSTAQMQERASHLADVITQGASGPGDRPSGDFPVGLAFGGPTSGTIAVIVGPQGTVLARPDFQVTGLPDSGGVTVARTGVVDVRTTALGSIPVRVLSQPVAIGGSTFVVQVIADRSAELRTLDILLGVLLVGGAAALALALFGGALYADRALVPIRESLRRQREFAADASHELRTPLAVIRGSVEHLERHPDEPVGSVGTALEDIKGETDHLTELVEELLLLARADSGAIELEHLPLDLSDVAAGALGGLGRLAEEHGVRLELDARPAPVTGDPTRLRQLVTILADNGIRHSPSGGRVAVAIGEERGRIVMTVDDQGPGISPDDREHVFERFWRAPDAPEGGSGLGLSIAKWIVERHGGEIGVQDGADGGTRFVVSLPTSTAEA